VYDLLDRVGPYIVVAAALLLAVVLFGFQEFLVVVWFFFALATLYLVYRFVLAFERIADAAQRFADTREHESERRFE
jgi:hypothetical protein